MPPVREASMKPTAATVLPAPVACSNQKRRLAPGSSRTSSPASSVVLGLLLEVHRLLVGGEVVVLLGDGLVVVLVELLVGIVLVLVLELLVGLVGLLDLRLGLRLDLHLDLVGLRRAPRPRSR